MRAAILCLLLAAVAVSADLQSDMDDIAKHLPMEQIELIGQKYVATYPTIRGALQYLQTVGEDQILSDLLKSKHVENLIKYFNNRGIDAEGLLRHMVQKALAFHRKLLEQPSSNSNLPAISGDFMADVLAVVNKSDLLAAVQEKEKSSPEYAKFLAAIRDPKFKTLFFRGVNARAVAIESVDGKASNGRGFFKKVWQKIKDVGFGIGVTIPLGK